MEEAELDIGSAFSMQRFLTGFMPENSEWVRVAMSKKVWLYRREFFLQFKELWSRVLKIAAWQSYLLCALIISRMQGFVRQHSILAMALLNQP